MVNGIDPIIGITTKNRQYSTLETALNLNEHEHKDKKDKFFFGFGLRDFKVKSLGKESFRQDPRFVKFVAEIIETVDDGPRGMKEKSVQKFGAHTCTRDEWANLYPAKSELDESSI
jgi:hypothetical protein